MSEETVDFWQTVVILVRRWYISVPAFFATLGVAAAAYFVVPLQYESGSVLVLTAPLSGGSAARNPASPNPLTNPLLNFDSGLSLSASIVIQQLNSPATARSLGITPGGSTSYEVTNGSTNPELLESGPFLFVTGTGPSPAAAQQVTQQVAALAAAVLAERQDELDAPDPTHIRLQMVTPPTTAQPLLGSPLRAAAAASALAIVAGLAAVFGFESMMTHRRRRRGHGAATAEDDPSVLDVERERRGADSATRVLAPAGSATEDR